MVITDVPFDAKEKTRTSRYAFIRRPSSEMGLAADEETAAEESSAYAAFLKEQERKCGPDGFLDSRRYTHTYEAKDIAGDPPKTSPRADTPVPGFHAIKPSSAVNVVLRSEQDKKEHDKKLKVIEDHMWQHKQEERELKRAEGDILKKRHAVRHALRDYENVIQKKRLQVDQKFNVGMEKFTNLQRTHVHKKEETTKQRTDKNISVDQLFKDQGRKVQLLVTDLSRQYVTKKSELELRQIELDRLAQDFETKIRQKEEEQLKLKHDLAELAIQLNMEAQKGRETKAGFSEQKRKETTQRIQTDREEAVALERKLAKSDTNVKTSITKQRKLSADLSLTRAHLELKNREEIRQLQDIRNELTNNSVGQQKLHEASINADLDLQSKRIDEKLHAHDSRKTTLMQQTLVSRKEKGDTHEQSFMEKFQRRYHDQLVREHEDHLKHFQKMVGKGEDEESRLYGHVREAEYARQKQEQKVRRLQQKLLETRRNHANEAKTSMISMINQEKELEQRFYRERAELDKLHADREESYERLQKHRRLLDADKHNYSEHEREHQRLQKIASKTEVALLPQ